MIKGAWKVVTTEYTFDDTNKVFYEMYMLEDEKVIGKVKLRESTDLLGMKVMLLDILNVDVKHVRRGVGKSLVKEAELKMKHLGAKVSLLYCLKDSWMKEWYERLGYRHHDVKDEKNEWMYKMLK